MHGPAHPVLAVRVARDAVKVEEAGGLADLVGDVGRIETKAGTQAALDTPEGRRGAARRVAPARLSAAEGGKTRAIVKLVGRGAIVLAVSAFDLATWLLWAALMLSALSPPAKRPSSA